VLTFVAPPLIVPGGESCKNDVSAVGHIHALVERHGLCRHSFVLALGGGAVLDVAGYATATAHRGLRLVRMPSTVLAQNDVGVGVKNGLNLFGRKNFVGTFTPPFAVVNDLDLLRTLPPRDLRSGMAEAVKVAAIKDAEFLTWLHHEQRRLAAFTPEAIEHLIVRCAELHLEHIRAGDPFENGTARPLDFGHWSAHRLEALTAGALRHGEAVAIGIALDGLYAHARGLLSDVELERLHGTLLGLGFELAHPILGWLDVEEALAQFREHIGGELCLTLPQGLGHRIDVYDIDVALMQRCIAELIRRFAKGRHHEEPDVSDVGAGSPRRRIP